ncbi:HNH endonuclease signature motif containing protein [Mycolicibacterium sp.]|uniref:HNH endonuclease signature motif containing protein n=1 Tax=Mycolicibacterium sp. TaxID=2320850 RepID=UPI0028A9DC3A|nr:HNH endonuclease signature motif containing protein [Mycolicibacterium sp.]
MFSTPVAEAFAALDAAVAGMTALEFDGMGVRARLEALDRLEAVRRRVTAASLLAVGSVRRCDTAELGSATAKVIADVVRISPAEARRRLRDAEQLQPRTTLTGEVLSPSLPATAKVWDGGLLDREHLRAIQKFVRDLPVDVHPAEVAKAESFLAEQATALRPDQLEVLAERVAATLNPDGRFSDEYRAAQRGFQWCGRQRPDGMSVGRLIATPELRAMLDAWLAKFAAPGMCNPDDHTPITTGEPTEGAVDADRRQHPQRQHDAVATLVRGQLGDPKLGQHNGLPVTVIATATVEQLCRGAGHAVTAGGSLLPMRDVIRMATHAWHYLAVFDTHTQRPIYLGRAKRIASPDQRIVLHATDRGCTAPGCDMPGYLCQTHHVEDWAHGGRTDVDRLTFACGPHHRLIRPGGWKTRKRRDGSTEWLPPPHIPLAGGTNTYHHPERMIPDDWGLAAD